MNLTSKIDRTRNAMTPANLDIDLTKTMLIDAAKIIEEITKRKILLKLKHNISYFVDGNIIRFSEYIKLLCCSNSFNYRITLESVDVEIFSKIVEFLNILDWRKEKFVIETKMKELDNWKDSNIAFMSKIEKVIYYLFKIILHFLAC